MLVQWLIVTSVLIHSNFPIVCPRQEFHLYPVSGRSPSRPAVAQMTGLPGCCARSAPAGAQRKKALGVKESITTFALTTSFLSGITADRSQSTGKASRRMATHLLLRDLWPARSISVGGAPIGALFAAKSWRPSRPSSSDPQWRSIQSMPTSPWPILTTVAEFRAWRRNVQRNAILEGHSSSFEESVGFVPTMGALHQGHADLVRCSLAENRHTVVSIFVNPAQFSPTEDFQSYPRTLEADILTLKALEASIQNANADGKRGAISALFCPTVPEMYPSLPGTNSSFTQDVSQQQGAFIEVKGLSGVLEGKSRPGFFRGVATVVTKLWHVVEPTRVYFGQKDIQQAIILRALAVSLLFSHPSSINIDSTFRLIPTRRDATTGLALSSRNAYLSEEARRKWAPELYKALNKARSVFEEDVTSASRLQHALHSARQLIEACSLRAREESRGRVRLSLDYLEAHSADTLSILTASDQAIKGAVLSGAMLLEEQKNNSCKGQVTRTRMIDNILLGDASRLLSNSVP